MFYKWSKREISIVFYIFAQKNESIYTEFLQIIVDQSSGLWKPYDCIVDFELIIWDGIHKVFPDTMIYTCLFHFKQDTFRWVTSKELFYRIILIKYSINKEFISTIDKDFSILYEQPTEEEFNK